MPCKLWFWAFIYCRRKALFVVYLSLYSLLKKHDAPALSIRYGFRGFSRLQRSPRLLSLGLFSRLGLIATCLVLPAPAAPQAPEQDLDDRLEAEDEPQGVHDRLQHGFTQ